MNITFNLPSPELEAQFVAEAKKEGLVGLKGHRSVGGIRASIYNALSRQRPLRPLRPLWSASSSELGECWRRAGFGPPLFPIVSRPVRTFAFPSRTRSRISSS